MKSTQQVFDFTSYIRSTPLPTGTYITNGGQKTGKTGFMNAVIKTDWSCHGAERKALAEYNIAHLNELPQEKKYNLHCPEHLYFSRSHVILHSKPLLETHRCDIKKMALPDGKSVVQYFPKYSFIIQQEYESYLNSRKFMEDSASKENTFDLVKYAGHNMLTVMLDGQAFGCGDKRMRDTCTDLFYIIKQEFLFEDEPLKIYKQRIAAAKNMYRLGYTRKYITPVRRRECVGADWTFTWIKNQIRNHAQELRGEGVNIDSSQYFKLCNFRFIGDDIRKCYNSFEGEAYFLKGIEDYYVEPQLSNGLDRNSVDTFCNEVPRQYQSIKVSETKK